MTLRSQFRAKMRRPAPELVIAPLALDPFSALIAQRAGYDTVYVGGGGMGYALGLSEALLTANDMAEATRRIVDRTGLAAVVDGGVGFGDAVHTAQTVKMMERAGACGMELEDQVAPKRAHHHKDIEHLVSTEEMCGKLKAALDARTDKDFVVIARCNASMVEGMESALQRCQAYEQAGADMIMLRARTEPEFLQMSGRTKAPLATLASWTVKSPAEMTAAGYAIVLDPNSVTILTYLALSKGFAALKTDPWYGFPRADVLAARAEVQELIGLEDLYAIEAETTEKETLAKLASRG
jgi:2-methylisocitrate lyase-like PEP mutase family enzyme